MGEKICLLIVVKQRQKKGLEHIHVVRGESFMHGVIEGIIDGKKPNFVEKEREQWI